jgi:hypothetical protein
VFPFVIGAWALQDALITVVFPGLTRRIGRGLAEAEGIVGAGQSAGTGGRS